MNPLVTVAIPTYKRLAYLQEAVASAQAQTYAPLEIIISDDGPGTEIGEWARAVAAQDARVRYLKTPRNLGLTGNWNFITEAARGEWMIFIGDDDRLLPDCVSKLVALAAPDVAIIFSHHHIIDAEGQRLPAETEAQTRAFGRHELKAGRLANPELCVWRNSIPLCAALMRTADAKRLQFKADLNTPEPVFLLTLAKEQKGFVFCNEYLMEYRSHTGSATSAGLWGERLVDYLLPWPASPEAEPAKQAQLALLLPGAVTRCLLLGEVERARTYLRNPYFTQSTQTTRLQHFCAALPAPLGSAFFKLLFRLRHKGLATPPPAR